ncbi:hypothetical protein BH11MYX1_BH11MYX1_12290 [soil metagenome]
MLDTACAYSSTGVDGRDDGELACFLATIGNVTGGSTIFLDLDAGRTHMTPDYLARWARALRLGGFVPGLRGASISLQYVVALGVQLEEWALDLRVAP